MKENPNPTGLSRGASAESVKLSNDLSENIDPPLPEQNTEMQSSIQDFHPENLDQAEAKTKAEAKKHQEIEEAVGNFFEAQGIDTKSSSPAGLSLQAKVYVNMESINQAVKTNGDDDQKNGDVYLSTMGNVFDMIAPQQKLEFVELLSELAENYELPYFLKINNIAIDMMQQILDEPRASRSETRGSASSMSSTASIIERRESDAPPTRGYTVTEPPQPSRASIKSLAQQVNVPESLAIAPVVHLKPKCPAFEQLLMDSDAKTIARLIEQNTKEHVKKERLPGPKTLLLGPDFFTTLSESAQKKIVLVGEALNKREKANTSVIGSFKQTLEDSMNAFRNAWHKLTKNPKAISDVRLSKAVEEVQLAQFELSRINKQTHAGKITDERRRTGSVGITGRQTGAGM